MRRKIADALLGLWAMSGGLSHLNGTSEADRRGQRDLHSSSIRQAESQLPHASFNWGFEDIYGWARAG